MRLNNAGGEKFKMNLMYESNNTNELMHYGVIGMKWGIRRAKKRLDKAKTDDERVSALNKLNKHRSKAIVKINKLSKQHTKLQKRVDNNIKYVDGRAANIKVRAARYKKKALRRFIPEKRAQRLLLKAMKMDAKADELIALSASTRNRLENNERLTKLFRQGINEIDKIEVGIKGNRE